MKEFAELGTTAAMDKNSSGLVDVLDAFTAPPIEEGKGRSETKMFLDGNHTRVSFTLQGDSGGRVPRLG